jgi:chromosome segregation ATPase
MTRRLTWLVPALVLALPGCKRDSNDPAKTEKVIEEVKDDVAEARNDIQEKQEDLLENQDEVSRDRASFIDATEKELADLDRRIQELRAHVQERSNDLGGQAKRDLSQDVAELEATRNEARAALDRFRSQTGSQMSQIQQVTQEAMSKLRRAVKDADQRLDSGADPDRNPKSPVQRSPEPIPPATGP